MLKGSKEQKEKKRERGKRVKERRWLVVLRGLRNMLIDLDKLYVCVGVGASTLCFQRTRYAYERGRISDQGRCSPGPL